MAPGQSCENGILHVIDLRSDTVTKPSQLMRQAMAQALVGDDVFGDDPTVIQLQEAASALVGKEAAIFVPSGTMGNLSCVLAHCSQRGTEVLLGDESHIYHYEGGGAAALGGVVCHVIPTQPTGELALEDLEKAVRNRPDDVHCPRPALVCIENSHNRCGGRVLSLDYMKRLREWADSKGLAVHLDGARVFNAAVALGVSAQQLCSYVDSVSFCLSKGLGCPVGSLVAGSAEFVGGVRRIRKMLGGGMRQVGVLAAPGLLALKSNIARLQHDHHNAQRLAVALAAIPGISLDPSSVHTNILVFNLCPGAPSPACLVTALARRGVLMVPFREGVRAVTHLDVSEGDMEGAAAAVEAVMKEWRAEAGNSECMGA